MESSSLKYFAFAYFYGGHRNNFRLWFRSPLKAFGIRCWCLVWSGFLTLFLSVQFTFFAPVWRQLGLDLIVGLISLDTLEFPVWEHDMPRALEKTVIAEVKEQVESCSSTTQNISPCQWPPSLSRWLWVTMRDSHPLSHMNF